MDTALIEQVSSAAVNRDSRQTDYRGGDDSSGVSRICSGGDVKCPRVPLKLKNIAINQGRFHDFRAQMCSSEPEWANAEKMGPFWGPRPVDAAQ